MASTKDVPKFHELMIPTLQALKNLGGSASNDELYDELISVMQLPDELVDVPHKEGSAETRLRYRQNWAKSYMKRVGLLENSVRGVWALTALGQSTQLTEIDPPDIMRRVRAMEPTVSRPRGRSREPDSDVTEGISEEMDWSEQLLDAVQQMAPDAFERLCQRLLREAGFSKVEVSGRTGDGGIDGHGILRVKLVSFQVLFQAKRWKGSVGAGVVRDFRGAMQGRADKGLIITTGRFTMDARREATRDGAPAIDLIDGGDLCDLLIEYNVGVKLTQVTRVEVDHAALAAI